MQPNNPFLIRGYAGPEYFCDRKSETNRLVSALRNDRDVTLVSPRRYGKTGLIHHVLRQLESDAATVYLDIFQTHTLAEFTSLFASTVVASLESRTERTFSALATFFRSCRPTMTPQADGFPKFSFDIAPAQAETTLSETFDYLARKERRIVVAIDEFQQLSEYPEKGAEAMLRALMLKVPNTHFVFAGSRQHLMREMFLSPRRPFYQSTDLLSLNVIDEDSYYEFASRHFSAAKKRLPRESFTALYKRFDGVTWYVQMVLNWLWGGAVTAPAPEDVSSAIDDLVESRSLEYADLLRSQNEASQMVLCGIAAAGSVPEPTSGGFLSRAGIRAVSTAKSALDNLRRLDLVYHSPKGWIVYDRFFGEWLSRHVPPPHGR